MKSRVAIVCMIAGAAVVVAYMSPERLYHVVCALFLLVVYLATKLVEQARATASQSERADAWEATSDAWRDVAMDYKEVADKWHTVSDTRHATLQTAMAIATDLERSLRAQSPAADKLNVN